jgi:hypothetical protein
MGISVGSVFFQTTSVDGIFGVLFQGMLFIMLGRYSSDEIFFNYLHIL